MSLTFSLIHLSRSEMAFIYVTSANLVDIEFSSKQRDSIVFNKSKLHNKVEVNNFYFLHYEFNAPLVVYVL